MTNNRNSRKVKIKILNTDQYAYKLQNKEEKYYFKSTKKIINLAWEHSIVHFLYTWCNIRDDVMLSVNW